MPLIHRQADAIVILWNKGDHDHVFFLTMSQLLPCLKDMQATNWSLIVFWNESKGPVARRGPDVGLNFTDQPAPTPAQPPQPPAAGEHVDYPGYDDPHGDMPVDDEGLPPPTSQQPEPDLDDDPIAATALTSVMLAHSHTLPAQLPSSNIAEHFFVLKVFLSRHHGC